MAQWSLFDPQANLLRSGRDTLANIPHVEQVIVTVPASRIVFIETPLPKVSGAKKDALLRYAIEDKLTIDPDTVHVVLLGLAENVGNSVANGVATGDSNSKLFIVAAIDRRWFGDALAWLTASKLAPGAAFSETEVSEAAANEWAIVLGQNQCYAKRHDGFAYSLDSGGSGEALPSASVTPPFALTLALREVPTPPTQLAIYTVANSAFGQAAPAALADVATTIASSWQQTLSIPTRMAGTITSQSAARLLALTPAQRKASNLLTNEFAPRSAGAGWVGRLRPVLVLSAALLGLQLSFNVADGWRLDRQRTAIEAEMRQLFQTTFPKATAIVDPALQLQRNLETLKRERGLSIQGDPRPALAKLTDLSKAAPGLAISEVVINENTTILSGSFSGVSGGNAGGGAGAGGTESILRQKISTMPNATLKLEPVGLVPANAGAIKQVTITITNTITNTNKAGSI